MLRMRWAPGGDDAAHRNNENFKPGVRLSLGQVERRWEVEGVGGLLPLGSLFSVEGH